MRALVILSDRVKPVISGVRVRNAHLWPAVRDAGAELKVVAIDRAGGPDDPEGPTGIDAEFFRLRREPAPIRLLNGLRHSYYQWPRSRALADRVDELARTWRPDVIHAEQLNNAFYLPRLRGRPAEAFQSVSFHNVESDLHRQIGNSPIRIGAPLIRRVQLRNLLAYERRAAEMTDLAFAYSEADLARYRELYPTARWEITRNGADVRGVVPAPEPTLPNLLFIGALGYAPNIRGLDWFLDQVAPRLGPGRRLTVAGSGAPPEVRARIDREGLDFEDTPIDLAPIYARGSLSVVPILEGSGTRGKILESLAHGRFVVTTTKGAEGLDLREGEGLTFADDPAAFADAIERWLDDDRGRAESAARGRQAVLERYDWLVAAKEMVESWERALAQRARPQVEGALA